MSIWANIQKIKNQIYWEVILRAGEYQKGEGRQEGSVVISF